MTLLCLVGYAASFGGMGALPANHYGTPLLVATIVSGILFVLLASRRL